MPRRVIYAFALATVAVAAGGCTQHKVVKGNGMSQLYSNAAMQGWTVSHGNGYKASKMPKQQKMNKGKIIVPKSLSEQGNSRTNAVTGAAGWGGWGPPTWPGK